MDSRYTSSFSSSRPPAVEEESMTFNRSRRLRQIPPKQNMITESFPTYGIPLKSTGRPTAALAIQENRKREKRDLNYLNDRFAAYVHRKRLLEGQNRKLQLEIDEIREQRAVEQSKLKEMYELEMREAVRIIDETEKDRIDADQRARRAQERLSQFKDKCAASSVENSSDRQQIDRLQRQISANEADINLFHRRLADLQEEYARFQGQAETILGDIQQLNKELDHEVATRIQLESQKAKLEQEIQFLKELHSQKVEQIKQMTPVSAPFDPTNRFQRQLSHAINEIRDEYDQRHHHLRNELESWYQRKVSQAIQEIQAHRVPAAPDALRSQEEFQQLQQLIADSRQDIATIRQRNATIEDRIQELEIRMHSERDGQIRATDEHDRQIKELRARLNDLDREYSELLSTKTTLHAEITSYQHLLDRAEISYGLVPLTRDLHEQWLSNQGYETYLPTQPVATTQTEPTIFDQVYGVSRRLQTARFNVPWMPPENPSGAYQWLGNDVHSRKLRRRTCLPDIYMREQRHRKAVTPPSSDYTDAYLSAFARHSIPKKPAYRMTTSVFSDVPMLSLVSTTSDTRFNHLNQTSESPRPPPRSSSVTWATQPIAPAVRSLIYDNTPSSSDLRSLTLSRSITTPASERSASPATTKTTLAMPEFAALSSAHTHSSPEAEADHAAPDALAAAASQPIAILENTITQYDTFINQISDILASVAPSRAALNNADFSNESPDQEPSAVAQRPNLQQAKPQDLIRAESYDKIVTVIADLDKEMTPTVIEPIKEETETELVAEDDKTAEIPFIDESQDEQIAETEEADNYSTKSQGELSADLSSEEAIDQEARATPDKGSVAPLETAGYTEDEDSSYYQSIAEENSSRLNGDDQSALKSITTLSEGNVYGSVASSLRASPPSLVDDAANEPTTREGSIQLQSNPLDELADTQLTTNEEQEPPIELPHVSPSPSDAADDLAKSSNPAEVPSGSPDLVDRRTPPVDSDKSPTSEEKSLAITEDSLDAQNTDQHETSIELVQETQQEELDTTVAQTEEKDRESLSHTELSTTPRPTGVAVNSIETVNLSSEVHLDHSEESVPFIDEASLTTLPPSIDTSIASPHTEMISDPVINEQVALTAAVQQDTSHPQTFETSINEESAEQHVESAYSKADDFFPQADENIQPSAELANELDLSSANEATQVLLNEPTPTAVTTDDQKEIETSCNTMAEPLPIEIATCAEPCLATISNKQDETPAISTHTPEAEVEQTMVDNTGETDKLPSGFDESTTALHVSSPTDTSDRDESAIASFSANKEGTTDAQTSTVLTMPLAAEELIDHSVAQLAPQTADSAKTLETVELLTDFERSQESPGKIIEVLLDDILQLVSARVGHDTDEVITSQTDNVTLSSASVQDGEVHILPKLIIDVRAMSPSTEDPNSFELIHALRGHSIASPTSKEQQLRPPEKSSSSSASSPITSSDRYVSYAIHEMHESSQDRLPIIPLAADMPNYGNRNDKGAQEPVLVAHRPNPREDDLTEFDATDNLTSYSDDILYRRLHRASPNKLHDLDTSSTDDDVDEEFEENDAPDARATDTSSSMSTNDERYHRYDLVTTPSSHASSSPSSKQLLEDVYLIPGYPGLWRTTAENHGIILPVDYDADDETRAIVRTKTAGQICDSLRRPLSFQAQRDHTGNPLATEILTSGVPIRPDSLDTGYPPINEFPFDQSEADSYYTCPSSTSKHTKQPEMIARNQQPDDKVYSSPEESIFLIRERERGVSLPVTMNIHLDDMALRLSTSTPNEAQLCSGATTNLIAQPSLSTLNCPASSEPKPPSWLNNVNTVTTSAEPAEGTQPARVTFQKSAKGPISISECHPQGYYVVVDNTSRSKVVDLSNWILCQENHHGEQLLFTFPRECLLKPNHSLQILSQTHEPAQKNDDDDNLIAAGISTWFTCSHITTTLTNPDGKERSTLTKKTIPS